MNNSSTNKIGAVIVTYNSAATLQSCLVSLWGNNVSDIVVVDNNSQDDSVAVARRLGVWTVRQKENKGFASACNSGASLLKNKYLLFLNPDAVLTPNIGLRALMHMQDKHVAAVGLGLSSPAGELEAVGMSDVGTIQELVRRTVSAPPQPTGACKVAWVSGGALLVRKDAWRDIQGFDEKFFMYWEDVDLCRRLRSRGWSVMYDPHAKVIHKRGSSSSSRQQVTKFYDASADHYFYKHSSPSVWRLQRLMRRIYRRFSPLAQ